MMHDKNYYNDKYEELKKEDRATIVLIDHAIDQGRFELLFCILTPFMIVGLDYGLEWLIKFILNQ